jgi:hypothetical protein
MALCTYCNKPAGFLRNHHAGCRERHDSAVVKIPELFTKLLASAIPVERFRELLFAAADASYVKPTELKSLVLKGTNALLASILDRRLLTSGEESRIIEILEALGLPFDNELTPYEMLVKVDILHELQAGKIPDRVDLADPLPMLLLDDEKIIWTFNHVDSYLDATASGGGADAATTAPAQTPANGTRQYFGLAQPGSPTISAKENERDVSGDLLVTSHHLYLLSLQEEPRRIPIRKISDVKYYRNGIRIVYGTLKKLARIVVIEDSWFAANLVSALRQHHAPQP